MDDALSNNEPNVHKTTRGLSANQIKDILDNPPELILTRSKVQEIPTPTLGPTSSISADFYNYIINNQPKIRLKRISSPVKVKEPAAEIKKGNKPKAVHIYPTKDSA